MSNNKLIQKQIKNYYLKIFLNSNLTYIKKDMRTYANYDDYKDVKYVSEVFQLDIDKFIQFRIKKSHLRLMLEVVVSDKSLNNGKDIKLYQDLFHIKKKDKIKNKILNITNDVDYQEVMKSVDKNFIRSQKLESLKNKI